MINDEVQTIEELQNYWRDPYKQWWAAGMPSFHQAKANEPGTTKSLLVKFKTMEDRKAFSDLFGFNLGSKSPSKSSSRTNSVYFPYRRQEVNMAKRYVLDSDQEKHHPRYPIYIISKGRHKTRHTAKALERMGISYYIAVEPQEYDDYCSVIKGGTVLKLPFSNHGKGSGPARNWCWEHSKANGFKRHWLLDDNISEFWRLHKNKRYRSETGGLFSSTEDYVDRFENVALASLQYKFFTTEKENYPPYILNTRVMSCCLIDNDVDIRWRGKYNEDVDLSIRAMKEGYCTMLFLHGLCGKLETGKVKGGNTTEIYGDYADDQAMKKSRMLHEAHPDCVDLVTRYGRVHHLVNLDKIINKHTGQSARQNVPVLKKDAKIVNAVDNYGMMLVDDFGTPEEKEVPEFQLNTYPIGRKKVHE